MTTKQTLLAHMAERHPKMKIPARATLADVQRLHARQHHRYHTDHYHEYDNEGPRTGPGTMDRRPSGWYTGERVVMKGAS